MTSIEEKIVPLYKSFPSHIRLTKPILDKLIVLEVAVGIRDVNAILDLALKELLKAVTSNVKDKDLLINIRLLRIREYRRMEDEIYKARKSMLRSHPCGYLHEDLSGDRATNEETIADRSPQLREAIEAIRELRSFYAEKIAKEFGEVKKLLLKGDDNERT
jgi:hypothetical protein